MSQEQQRLTLDSEGIRQSYTIADGRTYFTFSTGRKVEISNLSPLLAEKLSQHYPQPEIPYQEMPRADGFGTYSEPNPNDPEYKRRMEEWTQTVEDASRKMVLQLAVIPYLELTDANRREVKAYRDYMKAVDGISLEESDEYCYVAYCLIKSMDDYNLLMQAVMNRSNPKEAAIVSAISNTFQANVPG